MTDRRLALHVDYERCIGCETCEAVCRFENGTPRIVMTRTRDGLALPLYCHHCRQANCLKVCKRGALRRDADGAILLENLLCRDCRSRPCLAACPYAAMLETDTGVMLVKCDLCAARRKRGLEPACAAMCPSGAVMCADQGSLPARESDEPGLALRRVLEHIRRP